MRMVQLWLNAIQQQASVKGAHSKTAMEMSSVKVLGKKRKKTAKKSSSRKSLHTLVPVTELDLIAGLDEDLREAWQKLRSFGASLGPQRIYASHSSIMFSKKVCYFFVRPR